MDNNTHRLEKMRQWDEIQRLTACIEALVDLGDRQAVPAVIDAMTHPDDLVRITAIRGAQKLLDPRSIPALITAVNDEDFMVRWAAMEALEKFSAKGGVDRETLFQALVSFLSNHAYLGVQKRAARALATLGDQRAVRPILAAMGYGIARSDADVC